MKIENIRNVKDIQQYCGQKGIICPTEIAEKIFKCLLYEKYPIDIDKEDKIEKLYEYFALEKDKTVKNEQKKQTTHKIWQAIKKAFAPIDEEKVQNIYTIEMLHNYIQEQYKISVLGKELNNIYEKLIEAGLNRDCFKLNSKLQVLIDNSIIDSIVRVSISSNIQNPNINKIRAITEYLQSQFFAADILNTNNYQQELLNMYNSPIPRPKKNFDKLLYEIPKVENNQSNNKNSRL